jgi:hypothetical protein
MTNHWWLHGLGMFSEAYVLFSIGNLQGRLVRACARFVPRPACHLKRAFAVRFESLDSCEGLFEAEYPDCWKTQVSCSHGLIKSMTYTEIGGVIAGMVTMGYIADKFGRRNGSRITSLVMLIGCILLTASYGSTLTGHFTMFTAALAIFGYGVGVRTTAYALQ